MSTGSPRALQLSREHWERMRAEVSARAPEEACGFVAGRDGRAASILPVTNILHSSTRFRMHPKEQWEAFMQIEAHDQELIAIYHSHPAGPPGPSRIDIAEAAYPGVIHLIWWPARGAWECQGYFLDEGEVVPVSVEVEPDQSPSSSSSSSYS